MSTSKVSLALLVALAFYILARAFESITIEGLDGIRLKIDVGPRFSRKNLERTQTQVKR